MDPLTENRTASSATTLVVRTWEDAVGSVTVKTFNDSVNLVTRTCFAGIIPSHATIELREGHAAQHATFEAQGFRGNAQLDPLARGGKWSCRVTAGGTRGTVCNIVAAPERAVFPRGTIVPCQHNFFGRSCG